MQDVGAPCVFSRLSVTVQPRRDVRRKARREPPTQSASQFRQLRSDEIVAVRRASHRAPDLRCSIGEVDQVDAVYVGVDAHLARADDRGDSAEHGEDEPVFPVSAGRAFGRGGLIRTALDFVDEFPQIRHR